MPGSIIKGVCKRSSIKGTFAEPGSTNVLALRQRDNVIELQGLEKIQKMLGSRCLNRVAKTN